MHRTLEAMGERVTFHNAWSVAPFSDPNFASILTGTHTDTHGVLTQCMQTNLPTLTTALHNVGWSTIGASVKYPDGLPDGLSDFYLHGFDVFGWLAWHKAFPDYKLYLAHCGIPEPWFAMYRPMELHEMTPNEYDYVGLIGVLDTALSRFIRAIRFQYPDTYIILTADHGQGLGDRGMWHHREHLWWFLTHVPVVISGPGVVPGSVDWFYQHMDTTATMADMAGIDFPCEGRSWFPAIKEGLFPERRKNVILYSMGSEVETHLNLVQLWTYRTLRDDKWVLHSARRKSKQRLWLYACDRDPYEKRNMMDSAWGWKAHQMLEKMNWPVQEEYDEKVILDRLRALGYSE